MVGRETDFLINDVKDLLDQIETLKLSGRSKMLFALKAQLGKFIRAAKKQELEAKKRKSEACSKAGTRTRKELADSFFGL